jgi:hypothetical protein
MDVPIIISDISSNASYRSKNRLSVSITIIKSISLFFVSVSLTAEPNSTALNTSFRLNIGAIDDWSLLNSSGFKGKILFTPGKFKLIGQSLTADVGPAHMFGRVTGEHLPGLHHFLLQNHRDIRQLKITYFLEKSNCD